MQPSIPQLDRGAVARLRKGRKIAPRFVLDVEHKTIRYRRVTLRSELSPDQIDETLFSAGASHVCLRHISGHVNTIDPSSPVQIEYIDHAEDLIEGMKTSDQKNLVPDPCHRSFGSSHRTRCARFPHQFRRFAMQPIERHLLSELRHPISHRM
jgi:hypothetical protein